MQFNYVHLSAPYSFTLPLLLVLPTKQSPFTLMFHHHHYFRCRFSMSENTIWLFELYLISFNMTISICIHFPADGMISCFLIVKWYSITYIYHKFFVCLSFFGHQISFHNLVISNSAAIIMGVRVSILYVDLRSFRYMSGSYGSSIKGWFFKGW
jgi:hypothetical protein